MQYIKEDLVENNIKIGRDALFNLLRNNGLLVRKTKRFHITTDTKHFFYKSPNLLKDTEIKHTEQVLVCDITYINTYIINEESKVFINSTGNPTMAQGSMRDVLMGCISAFLAQGYFAFNAPLIG